MPSKLAVSANVRRRDADDQWPEKLARRCRAAALKCLEPMREVARAHGYALGLHGSVARDIDLIAAPWIAQAAEPAAMIEALRVKLTELTGFAVYGAGLQPERRPHGRLAWSIVIGGGPFFDISVMPARPDKETPCPTT